MADVQTPTAEMLKSWEAWVRTRPPIVREVAERFPPWRLVRLKSTGHRGTIYSYSEDGTVTVIITGQFAFLKIGTVYPEALPVE